MKTASSPTQPKVLFVGFPQHTQVLIQTQLGTRVLPTFIEWQPDLKHIAADEEWYKIALFINPLDTQGVEENIRNWGLTKLNTTVFLPLLIGFVPRADKPHPLLTLWSDLLLKQKTGIKQIVDHFSSARLVFFEGLSLVNLPVSLPHLLFSKTAAGVVYDITPANQDLSMIFEEDFSLVVSEFIKKPQRTENVIVRSHPQNVNYVVRHLSNIYQQLFQKQLSTSHLDVKVVGEFDLKSSTLMVGKKEGKLSYVRLYDGGFFKTAIQLDQAESTQESSNSSIKGIASKNKIFEPDLQKIFSSSRTTQKNNFINSVVQAEKKFSKKNTSQKVFFAGGVISAMLAVYLILVAGKFYLSYQAFFLEAKKTTTNALVQKQLEPGEWDKLTNKNQQISQVVESWGDLVSHPLLEQAELLNTGLNQLREYFDLIDQYRLRQGQLWQYILAQNQLDFFQLVDELNQDGAELSEAEDEFTLSLDQLGFFSENSVVYESFLKDIENRKKSHSLYQLFNPQLSELLGFSSQKNYLIVLQDSAELRPGGGFINAVAVIRVKNGQVVSFLAWPSHELSRMIGGNVSPPPDLAQLLNEKNWFFHDSNWGADFPTTAKTIAWFVEQGVGFAPDGVITLSSSDVLALLNQLETIEIWSRGEIINNKNFAEKQDFYAEKGVVELQNFSSALLTSIIEKSFSQTPRNFASLFREIIEQLDVGSIQLWFKNPELEQTAAAIGWSGAILPTGCLSQFTSRGCVGDYIYQVEANVGINRVNQFVKTQIVDEVTLDADRVNHKRGVVWDNTATTNLWPSGAYKNYVRWYLPKDAMFGDLLVNGQSLVGDGVQMYVEHDKQVVAVLIEVGVGQQVEVELSYYLDYSPTDDVSYMLNNQLQPGRITHGYQLIFNYPKELKPSKITPQPGSQTEGQINFVFDSEGDKIIGVSFE